MHWNENQRLSNSLDFLEEGKEEKKKEFTENLQLKSRSVPYVTVVLLNSFPLKKNRKTSRAGTKFNFLKSKIITFPYLFNCSNEMSLADREYIHTV